MHVRSLIAPLIAATLLIGVATTVEAKSLNRLVSVSQASTADCGNNNRDCDPPKPSQSTKNNKSDKKNHGGGQFNAAGKDMVYCLPPTC
ncbi:MAG: hypothetical protein ABIQ30_00445 [Devosia sp.]